MFGSKFKSLLQARFAREEKGAAHIEAMIMIPLMFGVMVTSMTMLIWSANTAPTRRRPSPSAIWSPVRHCHWTPTILRVRTTCSTR